MKAFSKLSLSLLLVLLVTLAWSQTALAQTPSGNKFVTGGTYTLREGETLDGNLYVFGGIATLEEGSSINGNVVLTGGTLQVDGTITGDILATGGLVSLGSSALVDGNVTTIAAHLNRAVGARITGEVNTNIRGPFQVTIPGGVPVHNVRVGFHPLWDGLWFLFRSFLWAAVAVLVVMFLPRHTERSAQALVAQPLVAGGVGLLTLVVVPLLLAAMAITLILIPVSLLGGFLLTLIWCFGVIVVGTEVGRRLVLLLGQEWPLAIAAGVGTFLLTLVMNGIGRIDCIGWVVPVLVAILGVGTVLLTRFGTQSYPPYSPVAPVVPPPAPPAARESRLPVVPPAEQVAPRQEDRPETGAQVYPPDLS